MMKYDSRIQYTETKHAEFKKWLAEKTVSGLTKSKGNPEEIKSCVFLFLHRAYEAHINPDEIVNLLGSEKLSILDMAKLDSEDEEVVMSSYELLDPAISEMYE